MTRISNIDHLPLPTSRDIWRVDVPDVNERESSYLLATSRTSSWVALSVVVQYGHNGEREGEIACTT